MNTSPTLLIAGTLLLSVVIGGVVAQSNNADYAKPVDRQWDEGKCHAKMVAALYEATDPKNPDQDAYLKTAEAYRLLDLAGQECR